MKAAQEFILQQKFADPDMGWMVTGASKRGWTSYLIGSVECESCVKILGIMPLVPIVPNLIEEMHHQYQSYGGFSFAFQPYMDADIVKLIDDPQAKIGFDMIDPLSYPDRLEKIPK